MDGAKVSERDVKRVVFHLMVFVLIGLLCLAAAAHDFFDPGPRCPYCHGNGSITEIVPGPPGVPFVEAKTDCGVCDRSGLKDPYSERLKRIFPQIAGIMWHLIWLALVGALIWGLKVVDCRLCGGAGRLVLESLSPEQAASSLETECVACEGKGRLGVLDRWVISRERKDEPSAQPTRPGASLRRRRGPAC